MPRIYSEVERLPTSASDRADLRLSAYQVHHGGQVPDMGSFVKRLPSIAGRRAHLRRLTSDVDG